MDGYKKSAKRNRLYPLGKLHPGWKGPLEKVCLQCQKSYLVRRKGGPKIYNNRMYCSPRCYHQSRILNTPRKSKLCIDCRTLIRTVSTRCRPCSFKYHSGVHAGNWRGGITDGWKCQHCGIPVHYGSKRCHPCYAKDVTGSGSSSWRGGVGKLPYAYTFTKQLKEEIRRRDGYQCRICHMTQLEHLGRYKTRLHVHHIDFDKMNSHPSNLLTACTACNTRANSNIEYWKAYCQTLVEEVVSDVSA